MAIGTPVPQEDLHPNVYVPQAASNVVPAEDMSGNIPTTATEGGTLHPEAAYPAVGAGAALAAQAAGRAMGSKNWFNSDFPEYHPSEPNPLPKNPGEFTDGTYKPGSPYSPGVYAPGKPYAPGPEFVRREFPGLPAELDKGPNAVENFALSQHKGLEGEGQFFGGQDYKDAYAKAMEAKQFNAGSTGFVVPQGGTPLALPPEIAAQKEQEYKAKLEAERAQREHGARIIHEQQEDQRQAEHNRAEAARRQAHEDREAHRLKTFNDIERQRHDNHAAMERERQNRFLTSESERQGAHASRQMEYQLAKKAEDARMAQEANQIAKAKLIGKANKLPGQIPLAGWNAGEAAERFQEPGVRNKIAGAINAAGATAPLLSHLPGKAGKFAGLLGPLSAIGAHFVADEPPGHKEGGHIQHFGGGRKVLKEKLPAFIEEAQQKLSGYLHNTEINPNPLVGNRYKTEDLGGLSPKKWMSLDDITGASLHTKPWDQTSRNQRILGISGRPLTRDDIVTHGGQAYARDLEHMLQGVGGASEYGIAKRIQKITDNAAKEGEKMGGNGRVVMTPSTMALFSEDYTKPAFETYLDLYKQAELGDQHAKQTLLKLQFSDPTKLKSYTTYPFGGEIQDIKYPYQHLNNLDFNNPETLAAFSASPNMRKALIRELRTKENQKLMDYNAEDIHQAMMDPDLKGIPPGFGGNTMIEMKRNAGVMPSKNETYDTNFAGKYLGSIGNIPSAVLLNKPYENIYKELQTRHPDYDADTLHRQTMGALYTRNNGVSEVVNDEMKNRVGAWQEAVNQGKINPLDTKESLDYLKQPSKIPGETRNYARGGLAHLGAA